jgi:hypothetical protein
MIPKTNAVEYQGRRARAEQLGAQLPASGGRRSVGCLALSAPCAAGMGRWLLVRRDAAGPSEDAYFLAHGPAGPAPRSWSACAAPAGRSRRARAGKGRGRPGPVRGAPWDAWHRHITLCLLAHGLSWSCAGRPSGGGRGKGGRCRPDPAHRAGGTPLVLALGEPRSRRAFRLGLVAWPGAHRAARLSRGHPRRRARTAARARCRPGRRPRAARCRVGGGRAAAPAAAAPRGRPRHDHRDRPERILAVVRTDGSWRRCRSITQLNNAPPRQPRSA